MECLDVVYFLLWQNISHTSSDEISLSLGSPEANEWIISHSTEKTRSSMSCHSMYSSGTFNLFDIATCHEFGMPCVS